VIRYAITDGARFGADAAAGADPKARLAGLVADAARWANLGVDFVQLREKGLGGGELLRLATAMVGVLREQGGTTKLLVNGRADVALAAGADGVHLTASADELTVEQVRRVFGEAAVVSVSCHSVEDVERARDAGVDLILFGPVFGKSVEGSLVVEGVGLEALRRASMVGGGVLVRGVGGVDAVTAGVCVLVGADGVAGIRLFA